ncbi:superoxide dismutase family protein [Shewanella marina]|uniref:superoxide dismutase family protein n=1 Tax=Shewanella marina TaxID=487319 RepID=UPI00046E7DE6|nr:superoxide dismutase family protein [Shewanella marina]
MKKSLLVCAMSLGLMGQAVAAQSLKVDMTDLSSGQSVGEITITANQYGTVFSPELSGLAPGLHGFHVHQNPSCAPLEKDGKVIVGGAAGGHYDPTKAGKHGYPWGNDNHKGDLPALYVNQHGMADNPVLSPRLTIDELKGRSLMIHVGGDNHSDHPMALGGGGARMVCGVIK